jgi:hypothetical protein
MDDNMQSDKTLEISKIFIKDKTGKKYQFNVKIKSGYDYQYKSESLTIYIYYDTMPITALMFIKDCKTGDYYSPDFSGWSFELITPLPLHKGLGTRLWKKIEMLFCKYHVTSIKGIIGQPPDYASCLGFGISESDRIKNEIARHFWVKMGFTLEDDRISKEYPRAVSHAAMQA